MLTEHLFQAGVELSDIGVITPYQLQSKIIRENLADIFGFGITPKVGSVEEFQGQERMVIVISTVRSSTNEVKNDVKCNAGFVKSARRLNVAVSRARAVVVIYGNPDLLGEDPHWRSLIHECKENGTFIGCERELTQNWHNSKFVLEYPHLPIIQSYLNYHYNKKYRAICNMYLEYCRNEWKINIISKSRSLSYFL